MDIKLLALDMDGTTLRDDQLSLSDANRKAIEEAISRGIMVVPATGRMRHRIPEPVEAISGIRYAVTSNGGAVTDLKTNELLYVNPVTKPAIRDFIAAAEETDIYYECYVGGNAYADSRRIHIFHTFPFSEGRFKMMSRNRFLTDNLDAFMLREDVAVEKINMPYLPPEKQDAAWSRLRALQNVVVTSSVSMNAEMNHITATKADGLAHLCGILNIKPEQVMSIGDNGNDIEMLKFSGIAVVPANGTDEAKALADYITDTNDRDGVAQAIAHYLL